MVDKEALSAILLLAILEAVVNNKGVVIAGLFLRLQLVKLAGLNVDDDLVILSCNIECQTEELDKAGVPYRLICS